jgi:hypothetical protein
MGGSSLPVEGRTLPGQVLLHPFSSDKSTQVTFGVGDNPYTTLTTYWGLPDQVADRSNGVGYVVEISQDSGQTFTPLVSAVVTRSTWVSKSTSLIEYQDQNVLFRLTADPMGGYDYDWLQIAFSLQRDPNEWNLAAQWPEAEVTCDQEPAKLSLDGFQKGNRSLLIPSTASADGINYPDQIQLHPCSWYQDTKLQFAIKENPYRTLHTDYALADDAVNQSNGVEYAIIISGSQRHKGPYTLFDDVVSNNHWQSRNFDLSPYLGQDIFIALNVSAQDDDQYDWLQTRLVMFSQQVGSVANTRVGSITETTQNIYKE